MIAPRLILAAGGPATTYSRKHRCSVSGFVVPSNCRPQRCIPLEDPAGPLCSVHRNHCETPTMEALQRHYSESATPKSFWQLLCFDASALALYHKRSVIRPAQSFIFLFPPPSKLCLISLLVTIFLTRLHLLSSIPPSLQLLHNVQLSRAAQGQRHCKFFAHKLPRHRFVAPRCRYNSVMAESW